jgi:glycosyltransferase involved in cell wall biosynthesis
VKIAFIVQRYGADILGGAEYHCRLIAERVAKRHQVEVLTTCAKDYVTWKNEYREGADTVSGVTVRRFKTARSRKMHAFLRDWGWVAIAPHTDEHEQEWLKQQGPWSPALIQYLERNHQQYDVLIFFTYLYAPTVLGMKVNPERSLLVPAAHDEPTIRMRMFKELFESARAIAYNTDAERRFVNATFKVRAEIEETIGGGVDLPRRQIEEGSADAGGAAGTERGQAFRRRHGLSGPILLFGGRINPGKGCEELFEFFAGYLKSGGKATLVLMGVKLMPIPEGPTVRFLGRLSDEERVEALEAADIVVVPSPNESLSLLALEALALGTPILATSRSEVLVDHCLKSNAGLFYENQAEFTVALTLLLSKQQLWDGMSSNGRKYVHDNYSWDVVMQKYERIIGQLCS